MFENLNLLKNLSQKQKIFLFLAIIFILGIIFYFIFQSNQINQSTDLNENESMMKPTNENNTSLFSSVEKEMPSTDFSEKIIIHITGHVLNPGIVHLASGARINDAIEAAGGIDSEADLTNINLAFPLEDGQKIYIPNHDDIQKAKKENEKIETDLYISESAGNTVLIEEQGSFIISPSSIPSSSNPAINKKGGFLMVNINLATSAELEELPGIGPSTASKIVDYRTENGNFKSIEDIKNVKGIGDAKYQTIKEHICVK